MCVDAVTLTVQLPGPRQKSSLTTLKPPVSSVLGDVTVRGLPPACVMVVSPCVMLSCTPCQVLPTRPWVTLTLDVTSGPPAEATNG